MKYRTKIPDGKVINWCNRQDCWAQKAYRTGKQLNQIKMSMNPEQIRAIRHKHYATRNYLGEDCDYK